MNRRSFISYCAGVAIFSPVVAFADDLEFDDNTLSPDGYRETHRLRIVNRTAGSISVSTDAGKTWNIIGRVLFPASSVTGGYIAAEYADPGTVAAIAVHGHRIRVASDTAPVDHPPIISLAPREYAGVETNSGFGGHRPGTGGIYTTIPAGTTLFRELSPHVGNQVYLENSDSGRYRPLLAPFVPMGLGEVLMIPVRIPTDALTEVVFQNRKGGAVRLTYASGKTVDLTQVIQPVLGIGRFDGTAYTGVGRVNTAHTGVITVSTAPIDGALPEGIGKERRGGFQISPVWHNSRCEEAGAPMVMTIGTAGPTRIKEWEGKAPLFRDAVSLSESETATVTVSIDDGEWEPMPTIVGLNLSAFTGEGLTKLWRDRGINRKSTAGVTAFRLQLGSTTPGWASSRVQQATEKYRLVQRDAAKKGGIPIVFGTYTIGPAAKLSGAAWARLVVDGKPCGFTNVAPYTMSWNTRSFPDGDYSLEIQLLDASGFLLGSEQKRVYVSNAAL